MKTTNILFLQTVELFFFFCFDGILYYILYFQPYIRTIEDTYVGFIETDRGNREKVRFYDIGGLDVRTRTIPPHFHAVADAYILVYSLTDRSSFQLLVDIKKDIEKNREKKDVSTLMILFVCFEESTVG